MTSPKRHHHIPVSYQLLFSDDNSSSLWYLNKSAGSVLSGKQSPRNFCVKNKLYTLSNLINDELEEDTSIENPILSTIDGNFKNAVSRMISCKDICNFDCEPILKFIAFLMPRQPEMLDKVKRNLELKLFRTTIDIIKNNPDLNREDLSKGLDLENISENDIPAHSGTKNVSLLNMINHATKEKTAIDYCGVVCFFSDSIPYVLSDRPILISESGFPGLCDGWKNIFALVPISKSICVGLSHSREAPRRIALDRQLVNAINIALYQHANQWIMGGDKNYLDILSKDVSTLKTITDNT